MGLVLGELSWPKKGVSEKIPKRKGWNRLRLGGGGKRRKKMHLREHKKNGRQFFARERKKHYEKKKGKHMVQNFYGERAVNNAGDETGDAEGKGGTKKSN